ncbi:DJ-1/PfpI/YhbO family deglycase/protease [Acinetobacter tianfuensis]|uniref:DJ-1/PfpI/YhbO family deglycase/protease n=1 Tax=Acinetobacter tianfuensis TaxID=2419603 RepID=A0A3A8ERM4_9GAMM|nr:DJ-1/PfpI/YhbO family deglycase/protease [Acinetobacter tianfuensis]RKG31063.1 DJ-1/PfpI/YhbO family deglycase/protease [Acinetobacter tianfuensis]
MRKKIAVLITHNFEDLEYTEPVEAFRAARHCISNIEHRAGNIVYGKRRTHAVTIDQSIDCISVHDFDALLIAGGDSPELLRNDARYVNFVRNFAGAYKPIMCSCHGAKLLINAQVVKGRRMTSSEMMMLELQNAGAVYFDTPVVNDNNLYITSRMLHDLPEFIKETLHVLKQ